MSTPRTILQLALALLLAAPLLAQPTSRPQAESRPATTSRKSEPLPKDDPAARALFAKAARLQFPEGTPPRLDRVSAKVTMSVFGEEGPDTKVVRSTKAEWKWLRREKRRAFYWRRAELEDGWQTLAWGRTPWLQDPKGRVYDLNERGQKKAREQLHDEMDNIARMMDILVLERLRSDKARYRFGERGLRIRGIRTPLDELKRSAPDEMPLAFFVGTKDQRIHAADYGPDAQGTRYRFVFSHHRKLKLKEGELLLPTKIRIDRNGKRSLSLAIAKPEDIVLNGKLPKRAFDPPAR